MPRPNVVDARPLIRMIALHLGKARRFVRVALASALLAQIPSAIAAPDDPNRKDAQPTSAEGLHRLKVPSVTFGPADIKHDMVAGSITLRIAGAVFDPVDFLAEKGQQFTVSDGKGVERWELKGRVTPQTDGTYLFDALIKCGDIVVARKNFGAKVDELKTIKVDGAVCSGKRKTFEADAKFYSMPGTKAGVIDVPSFRMTFKVYVDENGVPKSAQFVRREPPTPVSEEEIDNMASTLLTWTFDANHCAPKCKVGYILVPMTVN